MMLDLQYKDHIEVINLRHPANCQILYYNSISAQVAGLAMRGQSSALLQHSTHVIRFDFQMAAVGATVAIALISGTLVGQLVSWANPADQELTTAQLFEDGPFWTVRQLFITRGRRYQL